MEGEKGQQGMKLLDILADIRETESPGRRGGVSPYAQAIYKYFSEIQELVGEGFTMATICKYFERKGILPGGADKHSFRRAFRRESFRRKRAPKPREVRKKNVPEKKEEVTAAVTKAPAVSNATLKQGLHTQQDATAKSAMGLQVNPDNTFVIRPIDPEVLADFEKKN